MDALSKPERAAGALCLALALATLACYWPVTHYGFVSYDDPQYILENSHVNSGLTWSNVRWAFTESYSANWHPLTWLSHMLDCQLYGLNGPGHHFSSLLLHLLNSLLLFLLFKQLTKTFWRSALLAALFAWHPLHVESVAWAAERKDVLSTFFFLLTLWAYAKYAAFAEPRQPSAGESTATVYEARITDHASQASPSRALHYILALVLFALGLMSKAMLVTLPFVLLLLDFWPLRRCAFWGEDSRAQPCTLRQRARSVWPLVWEKLPFFALTAAASVVTYWAQKAGGAVASMELLPVRERVANACCSYLRYISKTLWPSHLSVIYPHPSHVPLIWALTAAVTMAGLSAWFLFRAKRQPYLVVGWFWFLGTLVPVIGLVQVGDQAMADRYMYIPSIGLFVLLVWGLHALWQARMRRQIVPTLVAGGALAGCLLCTSVQLKYWQNDTDLFRHAVVVTGGGFSAFDHLGTELLGAGKLDEAVMYLGKAAKLEPRNAEAHYNLGTAYLRLDRLDEAQSQFAETVRLQPGFAAAHSNWGIALRRQNKVAEAAQHFLEATRQNPKNPEAFFNLGVALLELDHPADAASCFRETLRFAPKMPSAHYHLAVALASEHQPQEAADQARTARTLALATGEPDTAAKATDLLKQFGAL